eukprot:1563784-Amphidinium_carterae.1
MAGTLSDGATGAEVSGTAGVACVGGSSLQDSGGLSQILPAKRPKPHIPSAGCAISRRKQNHAGSSYTESCPVQ